MDLFTDTHRRLDPLTGRWVRSLLIRYDNLFRHPFPYSMGWHGAPGQVRGPSVGKETAWRASI